MAGNLKHMGNRRIFDFEDSSGEEQIEDTRQKFSKIVQVTVLDDKILNFLYIEGLSIIPESSYKGHEKFSGNNVQYLNGWISSIKPDFKIGSTNFFNTGDSLSASEGIYSVELADYQHLRIDNEDITKFKGEFQLIVERVSGFGSCTEYYVKHVIPYTGERTRAVIKHFSQETMMPNISSLEKIIPSFYHKVPELAQIAWIKRDKLREQKGNNGSSMMFNTNEYFGFINSDNSKLFDRDTIYFADMKFHNRNKPFLVGTAIDGNNFKEQYHQFFK
jgi:hypothetical protein